MRAFQLQTQPLNLDRIAEVEPGLQYGRKGDTTDGIPSVVTMFRTTDPSARPPSLGASFSCRDTKKTAVRIFESLNQIRTT
jgi:hypothetical protein